VSFEVRDRCYVSIVCACARACVCEGERGRERITIHNSLFESYIVTLSGAKELHGVGCCVRF
jgi:hypothetical protein